MIGTFAPFAIAPQIGDPPLDACTPAIAAPPATRVLQCLAFLRELAGGRDGHPLDARSCECGLRLGRVDPTLLNSQISVNELRNVGYYNVYV
jgi:hypothetical protein